jgi:hypothetical protein
MAFNSGPMNFANALSAQDSTAQIGICTKTAPAERCYAGVG